MAEFCSRCGKTLSLLDPLLELRGLRFCEDCYPEVKREHAAATMNEKSDRKSRTVFALDDESADSLRGAIIKGNISTRSLSLKPGAVFEGDCRILKEENGDK